jgi:hypothetical protein
LISKANGCRPGTDLSDVPAADATGLALEMPGVVRGGILTS